MDTPKGMVSQVNSSGWPFDRVRGISPSHFRSRTIGYKSVDLPGRNANPDYGGINRTHYRSRWI